MAQVEVARSKSCVGALGRLGDLNMRMQPILQRANRLRQLGQAIALEDSTEATPFAAANPVEQAVRDWFIQDQSLGTRYAATQDSALAAQRTAAKDAIRERLNQVMLGLRTEADSAGKDADDINREAAPCQGAVFVRPAVQEACATDATGSQLCAAAADTSQSTPFRFVANPADLWDIEELRPWSDPTALQVMPDGTLGGARTAARSRLGNIVVAVALAPLIQPRAQMDSARAADFDANLDSLGIQFDVPGYVMAPMLEVQANLPEPIGGETHYLIHFGDPSSPDVIWNAPVREGGILQAVVPLSGAALNRLQNGDQLSFTAIKLTGTPAEGEPPKGEFVYGLSFMNVNQEQATGTLLSYIAQGGLETDMKKVVAAGS